MIELDSHLNDQVKNEKKNICIWHNGFMREYSYSNMVYLYVQKEMYLYTVYIYVYIYIQMSVVKKMCICMWTFEETLSLQTSWCFSMCIDFFERRRIIESSADVCYRNYLGPSIVNRSSVYNRSQLNAVGFHKQSV